MPRVRTIVLYSLFPLPTAPHPTHCGGPEYLHQSNAPHIAVSWRRPSESGRRPIASNSRGLWQGCAAARRCSGATNAEWVSTTEKARALALTLSPLYFLLWRHWPSDARPVAAFVFRRDLRLTDNTALVALCRNAAAAKIPVLPLFFFNPVQCEAARNPYFGAASFQFLCESLLDLDGAQQLQGRLVCLRGSDEACLSQVQECGLSVQWLGFNDDFTPFAEVRDEQLQLWCDNHAINTVRSEDDYTLLPPRTIVNATEQPYSVFTAFYRRLLADHVGAIRAADTTALDVRAAFLPDGKEALGRYAIDPASLFRPMPQLLLRGGRDEGLDRLASVEKALKQYADVRDDVAANQTSHLAPHLKFGTVSIREVWGKSMRWFGRSHGFPRQLVWREFYAMLIANHPSLVGGQMRAFGGTETAVNQPFMAKYRKYKWRWDDAEFAAFKEGRTGVPLVDAAVRCVTATGWCHNRARMVIANFLVKVLGVDWREGERWFATVAVDYDVANNSGGWLWSSGQGADPQPYFRTFNPFRQSARFDADCVFIYKWVTELRGIPPTVIHSWDQYCVKQHHVPCATTATHQQGEVLTSPRAAASKKKEAVRYRTSYPAPIVDIRKRTQDIIAEFKKYDPKK